MTALLSLIGRWLAVAIVFGLLLTASDKPHAATLPAAENSHRV